MLSKLFSWFLSLPYGPIATICGAFALALVYGALIAFGMTGGAAAIVAAFSAMAAFFAGLVLDVAFDIWGDFKHKFWMLEIERAKKGWANGTMMLQDALSKFVTASNALATAPGAAGADSTTKERKRRLKIALWVVENVIPHATASVESVVDPKTLDDWENATEQLINAYIIVRSRSKGFAKLFGSHPNPEKVVEEWVKQRKIRIGSSATSPPKAHYATTPSLRPVGAVETFPPAPLLEMVPYRVPAAPIERKTVVGQEASSPETSDVDAEKEQAVVDEATGAEQGKVIKAKR